MMMTTGLHPHNFFGSGQKCDSDSDDFDEDMLALHSPAWLQPSVTSADKDDASTPGLVPRACHCDSDLEPGSTLIQIVTVTMMMMTHLHPTPTLIPTTWFQLLLVATAKTFTTTMSPPHFQSFPLFNDRADHCTASTTHGWQPTCTHFMTANTQGVQMPRQLPLQPPK